MKKNNFALLFFAFAISFSFYKSDVFLWCFLTTSSRHVRIYENLNLLFLGAFSKLFVNWENLNLKELNIAKQQLEISKCTVLSLKVFFLKIFNPA